MPGCLVLLASSCLLYFATAQPRVTASNDPVGSLLQTSNQTSELPRYWTFHKSARSENLGFSVTGEADLNGDGFPDVAVGVPGQVNSGRRGGGVLVFTGSPRGLSLEPSFAISSTKLDARVGEAVCAVVDKNGDGGAGLLVGAPRSAFVRGQGAVVLYSGSVTGLVRVPTWDWRPMTKGTGYGSSICRAGDVNGDGFEDLVAGAPGFSSEHRREGAAWLFYGSRNGFGKEPGWHAYGGASNANFGRCIAAVGDVNGDGYADIMIAAASYGLESIAAGRISLYLGSPQGVGNEPAWTLDDTDPKSRLGAAITGLGDLNHDGLADFAIGAVGRNPAEGQAGKVQVYLGSRDAHLDKPVMTLQGQGADPTFGGTMACPGDVNGDGFPDLLISSSGHSEITSREGRVSLYLGSVSGFSETPILVLDGGSGEARLGTALAGAGDLDGDGLMDFAVGSAHYNNGERDAGRVDVFYGSRSAYQHPVHLVARRGGFDPFFAGPTSELEHHVSSGELTPVAGVDPSSPSILWLRTLALGLVLASASFAFWVWRQRTAAVQRERTRIARDLHDDLGSRLARLSLMDAAGQPNAASPGATSEGRARMAEDARSAMIAMREIVWSVDPANDTLEKLATFLGQKGNEMFAGTGVRCLTDLPLLLPQRTVEAGLRKNVFLAVNEALTNTLRHAAAKTVWLTVKFVDPELVIVVEDDGCGLPGGRPSGTGNGLRNMESRMHDIGGTFAIEARRERGTSVTFRIRI